MHDRDILKIKAFSSNDPADWHAFKRTRNIVNTEIKHAKEMYYTSAFHENKSNSKKTWNIINELTSRKQHSSHVKEIELNGCSISGSQKLSEAFNDHFADIGPKLADKIPCNENSRSHLDYLSSNESGASTSFQLKTTSSSIVFSLLSKLSKSKATGLDKILWQRLCTLSPLPSLEIDGIPVNQVSLTKSLGVLIDENLSWNMHINKLIKKIASSIGAIKRVRPFVPFTALQYIYNSLVQPHFNYCCVVWDNCNKTYADKLQKLQNRAARVLTSSSYDIAADFLLEKLGWRKLDTQRKLEKAVMVYKSLNGLAPDYLRPMFIDRSSITNYSLRDTEGKLAIPKPRTNYLKNSFGYSGAVLWNSLPTELRKTNNLSVFKSGCSRFFK